MNAREAFKYGFMSRCVEAGLTTPAEMLGRVKAAGILDALGFGAVSEGVKGLFGGAKELVGTGGPLLGAAALGLPPALGAVGGYTASKLSDISDVDVDEAKKQELINEYRSQSERLRREGALRRFTTVAPRPRRAALL